MSQQFDEAAQAAERSLLPGGGIGGISADDPWRAKEVVRST